jgi:hypothetical protein
LSVRCCKVDFRRDEDRRGMLNADDTAELPLITDAAESSYSWFESSWISKCGDDVGPWSKTLKSCPKLADPCKLRRFATGLPRLA